MVLPRLPMILSSFNDISPPSVTEWRGFITTWYGFFWMPEEALRADPLLRLAEGALLHTFLSRREQGR